MRECSPPQTHFRNPQPPPRRVFTDVTLVCKDEKPPAAHNGILTSTERPSLAKRVGHEAAPGGQLTLKDDSDAKITKGPKMKEKKLKSDKPDPSEEAQDLNKTKINFQP